VSPTAGAASSVVVGGVRLECAWFGREAARGPVLVFLHEGLGCVRMWRDFPARVADDAGARVLAYSRRGYGDSDAVALPRPLTYMHDEALVILPELLAALEIDDAVLVGHSDGGSIALIYAGSGVLPARVRGLLLLAPHVFCEDVSVASIQQARAQFLYGDLRPKLARYHGDNTDGAFWGWNDAWLDPRFRAWNIEEYLPEVRIPVVALQGKQDPYGTLAQLDAIERGVRGPFRRVELDACGHDPTRDAPDATRAAITELVLSLSPAHPATSAR